MFICFLSLLYFSFFGACQVYSFRHLCHSTHKNVNLLGPPPPPPPPTPATAKGHHRPRYVCTLILCYIGYLPIVGLLPMADVGPALISSRSWGEAKQCTAAVGISSKTYFSPCFYEEKEAVVRIRVRLDWTAITVTWFQRQKCKFGGDHLKSSPSGGILFGG